MEPLSGSETEKWSQEMADSDDEKFEVLSLSAGSTPLFWIPLSMFKNVLLAIPTKFFLLSICRLESSKFVLVSKPSPLCSFVLLSEHFLSRFLPLPKQIGCSFHNLNGCLLFAAVQTRHENDCLDSKNFIFGFELSHPHPSSEIDKGPSLNILEI